MGRRWLVIGLALASLLFQGRALRAQDKADKKSEAKPIKYKVHFEDHKAHDFEHDLEVKKKKKEALTEVEEWLEKAIKSHQSEFDLSKAQDRAVFEEGIRRGLILEAEQIVTLEPMSIFWDLGLWSIVIFVGLIFILRKMAWDPMLQGLQKREEHIRSAVEEAKRARAETERVTADFKAKMDEAYAQIPKIMEEARRDAEALKEELRTQAAKEIQTERARLRREIETARDQALQELWSQTAQLATLLSAKVLHKAITPEDHNRLLNLALEELNQSGERYREQFLKGQA